MLAIASCASAVPAPPHVPAGSWLLDVGSAGPHWLDAAWFRSRGLDPPEAGAQIQLSLNGRPVPYLLLDGPEGIGLFFYAQVAPTRYAAWSTYRLDVGQGAGPVMATAPVPSTDEGDSAPTASSAPQTTFWAGRWLEEDLRYLPQIEAPESWFWELIPPGGRVSQTVTLTDCLAGPVTVTVYLQNEGLAGSQAPAPGVAWDGATLGIWRWDGPAEQSWPVSPTGPRPCGEHTLVLQWPPGPQAPTTRIWLDGWGLTYRRLLAGAAAEPTGVTWLAETDEALLSAPNDSRFLDVSDPAEPRDLGSIRGEQVQTIPGHRYWAGVPWQGPAPVRSRAPGVVDQAALEQAEYLIVAPEPFWRALEPLVEYRQEHGLRVLSVTPWQVYDTFGDGRPDPAAIRAMVQQMHTGGRLRYVLLVGDGSVRPEGYAATGEGALRVVTALVPTAGLYETPSDQALVADDEGRALVAVGRFPARTVADVEAMVGKTIRWEKSGLQVSLVLTDDQPDLAPFADEVAGWLPVGPQRLDAAQPDARAKTLAALRAGGLWLNYVGHGSLTLWGDEKLLLREDRWPRPTVVTVWTCLSGYFVHPEQDSLAEAWLAAAQGGAVALVAPTGETYLSQQRSLATAFYASIREGRPLGDALLAGWLAAGNSDQDAVRSTLLLGDPALWIYSPD